MTMPSLLLSQESERLFRFAIRVMRDLGIQYAIGGGVAVQVHGYRRTTADVDLFILEADRERVLKEFRSYTGMRVEEAFAPHHYIIQYRSTRDPEVRIDLLIPAGEPELSAIEYAETIKSDDVGSFEVFPVDLLVLAKFYAADSEPRHELDIAQLLAKAAFDPATPRAMLVATDPDAVADYDALIASVTRKPKGNRVRPTKGFRLKK